MEEAMTQEAATGGEEGLWEAADGR